jgi:hypothetical protein
MSRQQRFAFLGLAVVIAVVAAVAITAGGDDDSANTAGGITATTPASTVNTTGGTPAAPTTTAPAEPAAPSYTVKVRGAEPVGGVQKLRYEQGQTVNLTVDSDTADEIHVHGYDLMKDVDAGGTVHFRFKAKDQGVFEIELEDHGEQIASLVVQ